MVAVLLFSVLAGICSASVTPVQLKLLVPAGYLARVAVLVRVEALNAMGGRERGLWDAQASLSTDQPGVTLSTNLVMLRNGMGSVLVLVSGGGDFTLKATLDSLTATRFMADRSAEPMTLTGGELVGSATTWSGVIFVTNDVVVLDGHVLSILPNTLVMLNGVTSGNSGNDLLVNGNVQSLGTEEQPVTITCAQADRRWGQIRHNNSQDSAYHHTTITMAGRAPGEGHTGQAPVIRPTNSRILFDGCSITDAATPAGTPGKIMQSSGSDIVMTNCLLSRARMGPEIASTALQFLDSYIIDMRGNDDADGIYLHNQRAGQEIVMRGSVVAGGDDDGIDTLGAVMTLEDCIVRDWNSVIEDAKGISVFNGATHVRRCLIVDCTVGIAAKANANSSVLVTVNNSTLHGNLTNVLAQFKGNAPGPSVEYRITNSVLWGGDSVQSDFAETNFIIRYSNLSEPWPGTGNIMTDPLFVDASDHDFSLRPYSPSIDAGDPASPLDADASLADQGSFTFIPPRPVLSEPQVLADGTSRFLLGAYPNRSYLIDISTDAANWSFLKTVTQPTETNLVTDDSIEGVERRFYRARVSP